MALEEIGVRVVANGVSQYVNGLKQMDAATDAAAKGMQNLSKQTDTAGKTMDAAKTKSTGFGAALGSIAKIASGFVLAQGFLKLPGIFSGAVQAASSMNETLSKSQVVFGDLNKRVLDFGATSAKSIGLSTQKAIEATATFGNFLTAMGVAKTKALDFSLAMVKLAADLASFNNASPEDVLIALRAGLSGETEPLKRFGIAINELAVSTKAAELGLEGVNGKLTEGEKVQARYALIMQQTATAQGDFARTSDGLANRQRILAAQFEDLRAKIGSALLPAVLTFVRALNENVIPAITIVTKLIGTLAQNTLGRAFQAALPFIQTAGNELGKLAGFVSQNRDLMLALGAAITVTAIPGLLSLAGIIGGVITKIASIGPALGGLAAINPVLLGIAAAAGIATFAFLKLTDRKPVFDYEAALKGLLERLGEIDRAVSAGRISFIKGEEIDEIVTAGKALEATGLAFQKVSDISERFKLSGAEEAKLATVEFSKLQQQFEKVISSGSLTADQIRRITDQLRLNASASPEAQKTYELWLAAVVKTDPYNQAREALRKLSPELAKAGEEALKTITPLEKMQKALEKILEPVTNLSKFLDPLQKALSGLTSALTPELAGLNLAIANTDKAIADLKLTTDENTDAGKAALEPLEKQREGLIEQRDALIANREALEAKVIATGVQDQASKGLADTEAILTGRYDEAEQAIGGQTEALIDNKQSAEDAKQEIDDLALSNLEAATQIGVMSGNADTATTDLGELGSAADTNKPKVVALGKDGAGAVKELIDKSTEAAATMPKMGIAADLVATVIGNAMTRAQQAIQRVIDLLRKTEELRRAFEQTASGAPTPTAQHGAFARAGQAHIVGEEGRELFVPSSPGFILPHGPTEQILSTAFARPAQRQLAAPSMTFAPNYAFQGLVTDDLRVWAYRFTEEFLSQARAESQRAGSSVGGSLE